MCLSIRVGELAMLPVGQSPDGSGDQTGPPLAWSWRPGGQEGWARGRCLWPTSGACRTNGDLSRRRDGKWTERQGWGWGAMVRHRRPSPSGSCYPTGVGWGAGPEVCSSFVSTVLGESTDPSVVSTQREWGDCCSSDHLPPGHPFIHSLELAEGWSLPS